MKFSLFQSILVLEDGSQYKGWSLLDQFYACGEIVFNTGMTGYQEIITDPSYYSQIVLFTYPEIGNTGVNNEDYESHLLHIKGIVAKEICFEPSNWRKTMSFPEYLIRYKIPHIFGIDTRSLTKHLRTAGVMKAIISIKNDYTFLYTKLNNYIISSRLHLVNCVTVRKTYFLMPKMNKSSIYSYLNCKIQKSLNTKNRFNIVLIDFGVKSNIINRLLVYGCNIYVLPANTTYNIINSYKPDGIILSNGPGDPSVLTFAINTIKQLVMFANIPIFGICMGHQILSLALQAETFKLKFGHRGLNHPAGYNQISEITSQNHGFAVNFKSSIDFQKTVKMTHFNLNDLTIAGFFHVSKPIFSVQYHPEASPGPHDSDYLFKYFIDLIVMTHAKL
uniref:Carbamoyl phosphate synthase small chain n=1 Tax=Campylaephora sungminbooi TaxID=1896769 RepID=A0A1B0TI08_9FLOR|nr:carbamoyl-phosphate synthase small chain [Campylaephora sungminbooi]AKU47348.1 carbamoyl-phosphate synthase small chain [Campylaephora sungminbooi]ALN11795.1 carbamoyl-phosphate synthase small chain [Campylaephora sungminbooi]